MAWQNKKTKKKTTIIACDDLHCILSASLQLAYACKFSEANSLIGRILHIRRNSPIFHRVKAAIQLYQSESCDDLPLQESLASASEATLFSPSNIEISLFYAQVLVIFADKFELGIKECERALSVPSPVVLSDDERFGALNFELDVGGVKTLEGQIQFFRENILFLIYEAKCAIINPSIVRDYRKCTLLVWKMRQDPTQIGKKITEKYPKRVQVKSYLESFTAVAMRKKLTEIDVSDIREHCKEANDVLLEALPFAEGNCTWKFWFCPICTEKFGNSNLYLRHVVSEHGSGGLSGELKELFPQPVSQDWAERLADESWLPIDVDAAVAMFEQMPEWSVWPVSNNEKRRKLLKRIGVMFRMLVMCQYLSVGHLDRVLNYAMEQVRCHPSMSLLMDHGMNELSTLCILVLDECHLTEIIAFLDPLSEACKLGKYSEGRSFHDGLGGILDALDAANSEVLERIFLDCDSSKFIVDPRAFCKQFDHHKGGCSCFDDGLRCVLDVEAVVSWLYKGKSRYESFLDWCVLRDLKRKQGLGIFRMLQQEFHLLHYLCVEKRGCFARFRDFKHIEKQYKDEMKKRGNDGEVDFPSCEAILMKMKEDASKEAERKSEAMEMAEAVSVVLEMVKLSKKPITLYEEEDATSYSSSLNGLKDGIMETNFKTIYFTVSSELNKLDVEIMQCLSRIRQLELVLGQYCSLDFLTVLTPFVKSYLQMFLEEEAENFARDKSNFACKALLQEECDNGYSDTGANHPTRSQKKPKDKKKCN